MGTMRQLLREVLNACFEFLLDSDLLAGDFFQGEAVALKIAGALGQLRAEVVELFPEILFDLQLGELRLIEFNLEAGAQLAGCGQLGGDGSVLGLEAEVVCIQLLQLGTQRGDLRFELADLGTFLVSGCLGLLKADKGCIVLHLEPIKAVLILAKLATEGSLGIVMPGFEIRQTSERLLVVRTRNLIPVEDGNLFGCTACLARVFEGVTLGLVSLLESGDALLLGGTGDGACGGSLLFGKGDPGLGLGGDFPRGLCLSTADEPGDASGHDRRHQDEEGDLSAEQEKVEIHARGRQSSLGGLEGNAGCPANHLGQVRANFISDAEEVGHDLSGGHVVGQKIGAHQAIGIEEVRAHGLGLP